MIRVRTYPRVLTLRPSVISVVAAFGALGGCDSGPYYSVVPPPCEDASASGCVPSVCDDAPPTEGSPCENEDLTCAYEDGSCGPQSPLEATCRGGRWEFARSSCNPPGPPLTEDCPSEAPADVTPCAVSEEEQCTYGDCFGSPVFGATCKNELWQVSEWSCNPPAPECPNEQPTAGAGCAGVVEACFYGDCYGVPTVEAKCTANGWQIVETTCNPPPPECPEQQPQQDAACTYLGGGCDYKDCTDPAHILAKCIDGEWDLRVGVCN